MQFRKMWMKAAALAVACMTAFGAAGIPAQARVYMMSDGGVFDGAYYARNNPDVVHAIGANIEVLYQHYLKYGKAEGRLPYDGTLSPWATIAVLPDGTKFDPVYYAAHNPDVAQALGKNPTVLYQHYVSTGKAEGRAAYDPSAASRVAHTQNEYTAQIVKLVNQARAEAGVPALSESAALDKDAAQRALEVNTTHAHTRPDGSAWYTLDPANMYGENIAFEFELSDSPEDVFTAWMNSEGHRANILDPSFSAIGVGYYINDNNSVSIVQNFS